MTLNDRREAIERDMGGRRPPRTQEEIRAYGRSPFEEMVMGLRPIPSDIAIEAGQGLVIEGTARRL